MKNISTAEVIPFVPVNQTQNELGLKINENFQNVSNILNVKIPARLENKIRTGHDVFDTMMGGADKGCDAGFVTLFTGGAGTGKSTLMLEVADCITAHTGKDRKIGGTVVVNLTEQDIGNVRKRVDQLGLVNGFHACAYTNVEDLIAYVDQFVEKPAKGLKSQDFIPKHEVWLFIDSLFGMFVPRQEGVRGRDKGQQLMQECVIKRLVEYCKANFVILLVLGHVAKNGKAAGKNSLVHLVDAHLHLNKKFNKDANEWYLCGELLKNRGGPVGLEFPYRADKEGITFEEAQGSDTLEIGSDD